MQSRVILIGTVLAATSACGSTDARPASTTRHVVTAVPFAEDIHLGSPVVINREAVGDVRRIVHLTCDTGVVLVLAISRSDAPLLRGTVAQIQPTAFGGEQVALLLPPPGEAAGLPESANVPGWPRAATAAQRHRALRIVLPAIGLAAFTPFVPSDSATSSASAECAPRGR